MEYNSQRITIDPTIREGRPVVVGTTITVESVLSQLIENMDLAELFTKYPELTEEDVKSCLEYARSAVIEISEKSP